MPCKQPQPSVTEKRAAACPTNGHLKPLMHRAQIKYDFVLSRFRIYRCTDIYSPAFYSAQNKKLQQQEGQAALQFHQVAVFDTEKIHLN